MGGTCNKKCCLQAEAAGLLCEMSSGSCSSWFSHLIHGADVLEVMLKFLKLTRMWGAAFGQQASLR